jgi:hypothetical protein
MEKPNIAFGTHLPVLVKLVGKTDGPILECGTGLFSTPFLHFACYQNKRKLISIENNKDFYDWASPFKSDFHQIYFTKDWSEIDLSVHWSIVLIDHDPISRRKEEIKKLANSADYIVVHDTNPRMEKKHKYSEIYPLFKFRKDFNSEKPYTAVLSNFKDLSDV